VWFVAVVDCNLPDAGASWRRRESHLRDEMARHYFRGMTPIETTKRTVLDPQARVHEGRRDGTHLLARTQTSLVARLGMAAALGMAAITCLLPLCAEAQPAPDYLNGPDGASFRLRVSSNLFSFITHGGALPVTAGTPADPNFGAFDNLAVGFITGISGSLNPSTCTVDLGPATQPSQLGFSGTRPSLRPWW